MVEVVLEHEGEKFFQMEEQRGKKVFQVAKILEQLQAQPGVPLDFEMLCETAGQKYPQDVVAAVIALEMIEYVDRYQKNRDIGRGGKVYYVWTGPVDPTPASA